MFHLLSKKSKNVFIKANKAVTSIFMVFVARVRFHLLHNFNKCYRITVKKNKIEDNVDLLKKERGKREAFRKDF